MSMITSIHLLLMISHENLQWNNEPHCQVLYDLTLLMMPYNMLKVGLTDQDAGLWRKTKIVYH